MCACQNGQKLLRESCETGVKQWKGDVEREGGLDCRPKDGRYFRILDL